MNNLGDIKLLFCGKKKLFTGSVCYLMALGKGGAVERDPREMVASCHS